jgi:hypothetical protein
VITLEAKKIFKKLKNFPKFYLAGGTGLALQLGHRVSIDFDFFWGEDIPKGLLPKIRRVFKDSEIKIIVNHSEQLTVIINGVSVSFIRYAFPMTSEPIEYQGVRILPSKGIAVMKAYALGRRSTLKDYVDLYFTIKKGIVSLENIITLSKKKYGEEFDSRLFLEQLLYSKDIEKMEIQFLKEEVNELKIESFFKKEIKKINL